MGRFLTNFLPNHLLTIDGQKCVRSFLYIFMIFFCSHGECKRVGKLFDTVIIWVYKKITNKYTASVSLRFVVHMQRHP